MLRWMQKQSDRMRARRLARMTKERIAAAPAKLAASKVEPVEVKIPASTYKPVNDNKKYMSVMEVSVALNKTPTALEHMRRKGNGPAFIKEGRYVKYLAAEVRKIVETI